MYQHCSSPALAELIDAVQTLSAQLAVVLALLEDCLSSMRCLAEAALPQAQHDRVCKVFQVSPCPAEQPCTSFDLI